MAPIPITIITGFLGSGKTTLILSLLPQVLKTNPNYRLALLKNEFGDLAVDSQLASASAISGVQELLNGCICCNLVGQLSTALGELSQLEPKPNRIVVETSGSAFPATLAIEVNRLARTTGEYVLDGVVSVIDVENWKGYEDTSYTARLQAKYTDLIVFNKWELVDDGRFDETLDRVGDLEVDVAWVKSEKGWVDMAVVFGVDGALARELGHLHPDGRHHEHANAGGGYDGDVSSAHDHEDDHHTQEVEVLSVTLSLLQGGKTAIDAEKLMGLLKNAPKDEVYRIKAVLTVKGAVENSDPDTEKPGGEDDNEGRGDVARWILNWAFGRWTFTRINGDGSYSDNGSTQTAGGSGNGNGVGEHESSDGMVARMTVILARYESTKWTKKLKDGGFLVLAGEEKGEGEVVVERIS